MGTSFGSSSLNAHCPAAASSGVSPAAGAAGVTTLPGHKIHCYSNINDGQFGNSYSWIPAQDGSVSVAGVTFTSVKTLTGIGISRDNTGIYGDRGGVLEIEAYAIGATSDYSALTGDSGWTSLGSVTLEQTASYFTFSPAIAVYAIRVKPSAANAETICLDEFQIFA